MSVFSKRIVLISDDPLWRKAYPVLVDIFCRGVQETRPGHLALHALFNIALSPFVWPVIIARKAIHIAILMAVWWGLRNAFAPFELVVLILGITAILYKDIYAELRNVLLLLLVLITRGQFLRWMCSGYLSGTGFRQQWLTARPMELIVAEMVRVISSRYRDKYNQVMDLFLASNAPHNEGRLEQLLAEYSKGIKEA